MAPSRSEQDRRPATGSEFDDALCHAEMLLRQADRSRLAAWRYRAAVSVGWAVSAMVVAVLLAGTGAAWMRLLAALIVLAVSGAVTVAIRSQLVGPLMEACRRDERSAVGTVSLLRELLPFIAREEAWTLFRIEQARLRIGRFPVQGGRS